MTTATGDYALDFNGYADENPFSDADFTLGTVATGKVLTNQFVKVSGSGRIIYMLTGATYDGGDVTAKVEVDSANVGGDSAVAAVLDENGDGFVLMVGGNNLATRYYDNYTTTEAVGSASVTFSAGDVFGLTVTKGSPNTLVVTQNGTPVSMTASTYSATLSSMRAGFGLIPENLGTCAIGSFAADGVTGSPPSSPVLMGACCL